MDILWRRVARLRYYATCNGTNPVWTYVDPSIDQLDELDIALELLKFVPACAGDVSQLSEMQNLVRFVRGNQTSRCRLDLDCRIVPA